MNDILLVPQSIVFWTRIAATIVTVGVLLGVEFLESTFKKLRLGSHAMYRKSGESFED